MLNELIIPSANLDEVKRFSGGKDKLGSQLQKSVWNENELPEIAIIGIPEARTSHCKDIAEGVTKIREQLYNLSGFSENQKIVDLGNIKIGKKISDTYFAVKMVAEELSKYKIPILVIGGSQDLTLPLLTGINGENKTVTIIDDRIDISTDDENPYDEKFVNNFSSETEVNIIGIQSYFVSQKTKDEFSDNITGEIKTLGKVREKLKNVEPMLRESDLVSFDYGAIKMAEAPGQYRLSPNGLTGEEACQLSWYSGIATSPVWLGLFGYSPKHDQASTGAMMAAQLCWYFINGKLNKSDNAPADEATDFIHYQVSIDGVEESIVFLKHPTSKRWWIEVPSADCDAFPARIACSKRDYKRACKNEMPDRWWKKYNQLF